MNCFIREKINGNPDAGSKARNDVSAILEDAGWKPIELNFLFNVGSKAKGNTLISKVKDNIQLRMQWGRVLKRIHANDTLLIQFPVLKRPVLLALAIKALRKRGGSVVLLIHDLELLR